MITKQFKHLIKEFGSLYQVGHYPTSDEVNSMPQISKYNEWGCMVELADGVIVDCAVTPFNESMVYGSFHRDGADAEVFELDQSKKNRFFNEFKKRIEEKYDQKFLDEKEAKKKFESYLEKIFI